MYGIISRWLELVWQSSAQSLWELVTDGGLQPPHGYQEEGPHYLTQYSGSPVDTAPATRLDEVEDGPNGRKPESGAVRRRLVGATTDKQRCTYI